MQGSPKIFLKKFEKVIKNRTKKSKRWKNNKKNCPLVKTWETGIMCTFSFRANKSKW